MPDEKTLPPVILGRYAGFFSRGAAFVLDRIIAFGIALVVQNAIQIIWTPMSRSLITDYSFESIQIGDIYIPVVYILDFAAALVVMLILHQFLKRTYLGQAITA